MKEKGRREEAASSFLSHFVESASLFFFPRSPLFIFVVDLACAFVFLFATGRLRRAAPRLRPRREGEATKHNEKKTRRSCAAASSPSLGGNASEVVSPTSATRPRASLAPLKGSSTHAPAAAAIVVGGPFFFFFSCPGSLSPFLSLSLSLHTGRRSCHQLRCAAAV